MNGAHQKYGVDKRRSPERKGDIKKLGRKVNLFADDSKQVVRLQALVISKITVMTVIHLAPVRLTKTLEAINQDYASLRSE